MANRRRRLAAARDRHGHTQESLARALGVEPSTVARWERGAGTPRPGVRTRLAAELGITLDELTGLLDGDAPDALAPTPPTPRTVAALNVIGQADAADAVDALHDLVDHYAHAAAETAYDELLQLRRHAGELSDGLAGPRRKDLAVATGWLSTLLAMAASGAGDTAAAVVWCRDAERHGRAAGHLEIVGWSEMTRAVISYYQGSAGRSAAIAERGRVAAPVGTVVHARLAAQEMRAVRFGGHRGHGPCAAPGGRGSGRAPGGLRRHRRVLDPSHRRRPAVRGDVPAAVRGCRRRRRGDRARSVHRGSWPVSCPCAAHPRPGRGRPGTRRRSGGGRDGGAHWRSAGVGDDGARPAAGSGARRQLRRGRRGLLLPRALP
ncbi:helix-turn-helix transcriptional regulator [Spiractinospora alimapuensis]|nr:helix-turn-helix transcriptional regulator [Spiractinospora alimapuensis]